MKLLEQIKRNSGLALIDEHHSLTYEQLFERAKTLSAKLNARQVVALVMENSIASITDYIACLIAQAPMLLLSDPAELDNYREYRPSYLVHSNQVTPLHNAHDSSAAHSDLRLLLSTSGSTGRPKLVRLSSKNLDANTASIVNYLEISSQCRSITSLPLTYSFGLSILNSYLWAGASLVVTDLGITEKKFWTLMKHYSVSSLSGVPFHFETLMRMRFLKMRLPALKVFTQAGGKLQTDVLRAFGEHCQANNQRFYVMYGQTEAAPRISYLPFDHLLSKIGSIGTAIPGGKLLLINEDGEEISSADQEGELVYKGENVMMGYATRFNDLKLGYGEKTLHTGDLARRDKDGFFYITGRKNRFIKMQGKRLSLSHLEETLQQRGVAESVCLGEDDSLIVAFTETENESTIAKYLQELNINPAYYQFFVLENIPRTSSGKVEYNTLSKWIGLA